MALIVEDGTGVAGAEALVSVSEVTDYLTDRQRNTSWDDASTAAKEASIRKAQDYLEARWSHLLRGTRTHELCFPRRDLYSLETGDEITGVPSQIKVALCEYAFSALSENLFTAPVAAREVTRVKEVVGPLEVETEYQPGTSRTVYLEIPFADALVRRFTYDVRRVIR